MKNDNLEHILKGSSPDIVQPEKNAQLPKFRELPYEIKMLYTLYCAILGIICNWAGDREGIHDDKCDGCNGTYIICDTFTGVDLEEVINHKITINKEVKKKEQRDSLRDKYIGIASYVCNKPQLSTYSSSQTTRPNFLASLWTGAHTSL